MNKKQRLRDSKLVLDYQSGNTMALQILVKHWHKTFCEKAYWLVKDADLAKDIAQDSWGTIITKISHLENPESFGSWAMRIVYTKSLDCIKNNKKSLKHLETYKYEQDTIEIEKTDTNIIKEELLISIKQLPENQQVVIGLFYVQDYSLKEISDLLNIQVGTVKSRLFHAREKLKQKLKHRNHEE
jgi:RNA polymerase sigma-70 factor (ECF subfamily)